MTDEPAAKKASDNVKVVPIGDGGEIIVIDVPEEVARKGYKFQYTLKPKYEDPKEVADPKFCIVECGCNDQCIVDEPCKPDCGALCEGFDPCGSFDPCASLDPCSNLDPCTNLA